MNRRSFLNSAVVAGTALSVRPSRAAKPAAPKIKAGQIGTRHAHASGKLSTMRKLTDIYDVVGVVEPDLQRRKQLESSGAYRGVKWVTEEQLLNTTGLQAVAIETEVNDLVPTGTRCVSAGVNIHLDKPAGESLSEFKKLLDIATAKKLTVQMGYMFRYNPAFQLAYQAAAEGWLGQVFELHGVISKKVGASSRKQLAKYRGGTIFELGCHLIDSVIKILGKPQRVTPLIRRTQDDGLADNMLATFEYPQATATIRSSVVEPFGGRRRQFTVVGTGGVVDIRPLEPPRVDLALEKAHGKYKAGTQQVELPKMTGRYDGEFIDLAAVIRGEKKFEWGPEHDLATHDAILKASGL